eukprot:TRINITY_DN8119_c0_g1_i2.p1 TRINITY_DN8119_c0_g1~~TRINITY_DN8119_c0_g1_i2.p1  ORF type:complete len:323 (+),score=53.23 TRINITY_DN8119_c0_g1_i2:222-1190(+)
MPKPEEVVLKNGPEDLEQDLSKPLDARSTSLSSMRANASRLFGDADPELGDGSLMHQLGSQAELDCLAELEARIKDDQQCLKLKPFWRLACLRARKYDIDRTLILIKNYVAWREEFRIDDDDIRSDKKLAALVERGIHCVHGNRDKMGRYVVTARLARADPAQYPADVVIRGIHVVLESLLIKHPDAQARGIVMVGDMRGVNRSHADPRVPKELFSAFTNTMPIRFGGMYLCSPPWFMRLLFPLVKMFMKKKMQERMHIVTSLPDALTKYIAMEQIPDDLGGTYGYSRAAELDYNRLVATCHDQSKHPDPKHPSHKCSITDV